MLPHPHTVFVNRPARRRSRLLKLLPGSVAMAVLLLTALSLLGRWQAEASHAAPPRVAMPAAPSVDPSVPDAGKVLRNAAPVPDEAVNTF